MSSSLPVLIANRALTMLLSSTAEKRNKQNSEN
jgi:hypothetical protein